MFIDLWQQSVNLSRNAHLMFYQLVMKNAAKSAVIEVATHKTR